MLSEGISLILVDDEAEIVQVQDFLGVTAAVPLDDMVKHLDVMYEVAFTVVFKGGLENALKYLHAYNVRRAIVVVEGKATAYGRDLTWIKKSLQFSSRKVTEGVLPEPKLNLDFMQGRSFEQPVERDDPYESLGYGRR
jgi:hypothetical protein